MITQGEKQTWVTCKKCNEKSSLSSSDVTLYRENWYHLSCWKALVGKF
ncbi:hypothetical protein [Candidatus Nitrosotenuis cloacae]|nr:hypothetical protein [Candidatus Nitrosotenuis cloacae]